MAALFLGPGEPHPRSHNGRKHCAEGLADGADKCEITRPGAAVEVIKKDPTDAAGLVAMLEEKVFVAPRPEALVAVAIVGRAGVGERGVEFRCRELIGVDRR